MRKDMQKIKRDDAKLSFVKNDSNNGCFEKRKNK